MSALLTIGVPIHNGEATLDRCLGSITAYAPEGVEVLMSDNASTDRTEAICREYASNNPAFRYVRQARNIGSMANFKFLLGEARTPYFMWLADDDWLGDEFVDRALAFMESHPDYVLASAAACAYYSRVNGEYQFTTLTCGIEDDDPARRVQLYLENLADNSEFYGIYRRSAMRFDPPDTMGADWITMIDTSYLGKIRSVEGTVLHRQNRWDTPGRHAAVAAGAGLPAAQGKEPHYATALAALVHVALASSVYSSMPEDERLRLAASVFRRLRRHEGLPDHVRFWPDAQRLFGETFARRHGSALRALIDRACTSSIGTGKGSFPLELLELALSLNLGSEPAEPVQEPASPPTILPEEDGSPAALAWRALRKPAYLHPSVPEYSRFPDALLDEYARFLTAPQHVFDTEPDIEAHSMHLLRVMETLLPEEAFAGHGLRLSPQRVRAIGAFVRRLSVAPCYVSKRNLRGLMEKRAHLGSLWLRHEGVQVDATMPGGAAGKRLRVGLVLRDAVTPADALAALPAISNLDRGRFETVALVTSLAGGPQGLLPAEEHLLRLAERAALLQGDLNAMIAAVRAENFDVLLFANTASSPDMFLLSLCRLGRRQVALNSCRATTGSEHMDFFVSSEPLEARGQAQDAYTERLVMLDGAGHARVVAPFEAQLAAPMPSEPRDHGREIRLVSGARHFKLTPQVRGTWMRLLAALPDATLALYPFGSTPSDVPYLKHALKREAEAAGVDFSRVRILPPFDSAMAIRHFLRTTDVYLDSFPFTGVHSLLDPLMAGIPAVTLAGDSLRSNLGSSLLHELGFPEWVATTPSAYEEIVRALVTNSEALRAAKKRVDEAMARSNRFFDTTWHSSQFARILENIASDRLVR